MNMWVFLVLLLSHVRILGSRQPKILAQIPIKKQVAYKEIISIASSKQMESRCWRERLKIHSSMTCGWTRSFSGTMPTVLPANPCSFEIY